jgi:hypothetical protein
VVPLSSVLVEASASGCDSGSLDGRKEMAAHPCIVLPPERSSPALIDRHYASRAANTVCGPDWSRVAVRSGPFRRGHIAIGRTGGGHRQPRHRASLTTRASAATTIQTNVYCGGGGGWGVLDIL